MSAPLIKSLRLSQWSKNLFVFAPLLFAGELDEPQQVLRALLAFLAFGLAASAVYLNNDLQDREQDRLHPLKKHRPLAAGTLSPRTAVAAAVVLVVAAVVVTVELGLLFALALASYVALNFVYTRWLKNIVILDVMTVSLFYLLRVGAGAAAIGVSVSAWLALCTGLVSLFLIFSKRRHELILLRDQAAEQRQVLVHYSPLFLDQMINVVTASTLIAYVMYSRDPETVVKLGTPNLVWTTPLVLFGIFRYLYLVYQVEDSRNPTEAILRDLPFVVNVLVWVGSVVWLLYGPGLSWPA